MQARSLQPSFAVYSTSHCGGLRPSATQTDSEGLASSGYTTAELIRLLTVGVADEATSYCSGMKAVIGLVDRMCKVLQ